LVYLLFLFIYLYILLRA